MVKVLMELAPAMVLVVILGKVVVAAFMVAVAVAAVKGLQRVLVTVLVTMAAAVAVLVTKITLLLFRAIRIPLLLEVMDYPVEQVMLLMVEPALSVLSGQVNQGNSHQLA